MKFICGICEEEVESEYPRKYCLACSKIMTRERAKINQNKMNEAFNNLPERRRLELMKKASERILKEFEQIEGGGK